MWIDPPLKIVPKKMGYFLLLVVKNCSAQVFQEMTQYFGLYMYFVNSTINVEYPQQYPLQDYSQYPVTEALDGPKCDKPKE